MTVHVGDRERLLLIDFDRARTIPEDAAPTRKQEELLAFEVELIDYFASYALVYFTSGTGRC